MKVKQLHRIKQLIKNRNFKSSEQQKVKNMDIGDITESEFFYDPNDELRQKLKMPRDANQDGYSFWNGRLLLIIVHLKYLESVRFYTHEITDMTLRIIFQKIAHEDDISDEGIYWLNRIAHDISPYGINKGSTEKILKCYVTIGIKAP
jgi:hypothetical protein